MRCDRMNLVAAWHSKDRPGRHLGVWQQHSVKEGRPCFARSSGAAALRHLKEEPLQLLKFIAAALGLLQVDCLQQATHAAAEACNKNKTTLTCFSAYSRRAWNALPLAA